MKLHDVLNRVLRATGQPQVPCEQTLLTDDNHIMIVEYINQFKEEIEESHPWRALRLQSPATLSADSVPYVSVVGTSRKSRIVRIHDARFGRLVPLVFDVTDANNPHPIQEIDLSLMEYKLTMNRQRASGPSVFFANGLWTNNIFPELQLQVFPWPAEERRYQVTTYTPQDYADITALGTEILIPERPLIIGTIWYVLQERGEELGQGSMFTEERYRAALDAAISNDAAEAGEYELVPT